MKKLVHSASLTDKIIDTSIKQKLYQQKYQLQREDI